MLIPTVHKLDATPTTYYAGYNMLLQLQSTIREIETELNPLKWMQFRTFSSMNIFIQNAFDMEKLTELLKSVANDMELLDLLLNAGVDPSADDNWAIRYASENGHIAVVERLLMDPRVDPSADNNLCDSDCE